MEEVLQIRVDGLVVVDAKDKRYGGPLHPDDGPLNHLDDEYPPDFISLCAKMIFDIPILKIAASPDQKEIRDIVIEIVMSKRVREAFDKQRTPDVFRGLPIKPA